MRAGQVYTDGDLTNILAAVALAAGAASSGDGSPHAAAFRRGYSAALAAVALAVGVSPADLTTRLQPFDVGRLNEAVRR
jgi:hypothetical protein